jgi:hypothetical protein
MNAISVDNGKPWTIAPDERTTALEIVLLKRTYVFPWSQFLYAEGGDDEIRLVFAAHDVLVKGSGLATLLADLAAQRVAAMRELARPQRFLATSGRFIREIVVQKIDADVERIAMEVCACGGLKERGTIPKPSA